MLDVAGLGRKRISGDRSASEKIICFHSTDVINLPEIRLAVRPVYHHSFTEIPSPLTLYLVFSMVDAQRCSKKVRKIRRSNMNQRICRPFNTPIREDLSWEERWRGPDKGLITSWEVGRELRKKEPELANRAMNGELPILPWKGGVEKKTKKGEKHGTLFYLAAWQGLRGEDLNIDLSEEIELTCSRTGMKVIYTGDVEKYANA